MIEFHELAVAELREIQRWYADRSQRAATRFRLEVETTINRICEAPRQFPFIRVGFQYARVVGFPYIVVYQARSESDQFVVAFAHTSRKSSYWENRP